MSPGVVRTLATSGWTVAAIYAGMAATGHTSARSPTLWWIASVACFVFGVWINVWIRVRQPK